MVVAMSSPILSTKLYMPAHRANAVFRPRLIERLNEGAQRKLTLISASAGYGKTTLVSEWLSGVSRSAAWLSLDEGDNDPAAFLTCLFAAVQTIAPHIGNGTIGLLRSPQPPPIDSIVAVLLNEIAALPDGFVLVLDDYHVIDSRPIDDAVALLIDRMPPGVHLVIATRENPRLPLARLRVRDQLTELRASDLRFTAAEAAEFLRRVMGLDLAPKQIALLESRTEGWIAGLQLAALSVRDHQDPAGFIEAFSGSHKFVLDYLVEETLQQRSAAVQNFLLCTSILERMCGPLCDAVLQGGPGEYQADAACGQEMLEYLEQANMFIVPLDNERRWYRYHHLFAESLRKQLGRRIASNTDNADGPLAQLHLRASVWCEANGLDMDAFRHAAEAGEIERVVRLLEGGGMPLIFRGTVAPIMKWLDAAPVEVRDANPSLWVMHASALLLTGQSADVEQKLQAAEQALEAAVQDAKTNDLIGHIAATRAALAVSKHQAETIVAESRRALAFLRADNLPVRTATTWALGYAYQLQGDRTAAGKAYAEALETSRSIGHVVIAIMAALGLGSIREAENRLHGAAETYRSVLQMAGDPPLSVAGEAHMGLARISYEWNDLDAAASHARQAVPLARQLAHTDRAVACDVFLARLQLARGEASSAAAVLAEAGHFAVERGFAHQLPAIADMQVLALLRQGNTAAAARLAQQYELPLGRARVQLAQGDASAALDTLAPLRSRAEANGWGDETLKALVLQAVAFAAQGDRREALRRLEEALVLAEPGGFVRIFVDEGKPMRGLLREAAAQQMMPEYAWKLLAEFEPEQQEAVARSEQTQAARQAMPLLEPLSGRELEVLRLIAEGLSNHEIGERLHIALTTVKGHNRIIFDKLQVKRRTEAVARAREAGLL